MLNIILCSTSLALPLSVQSYSSVIVQFMNSSGLWLFNCHEGLQHHLLRNRFKSYKIEKIFISKLTYENIGGLIGMLSSYSLNKRQSRLNIYGPLGLKNYIHYLSKYSQTNFNYKVKINGVYSGMLINTQVCSVFCTQYESKTFGYNLTMKQNAGKLKSNYVQYLGIKASVIYKKLKENKNFLHINGHTFKGTNLCESPTPGKKITYIESTKYCRAFLESIWKTNCLILNSTLDHKLAKLHLEYCICSQIMLLKALNESIIENVFVINSHLNTNIYLDTNITIGHPISSFNPYIKFQYLTLNQE